MAIHKNGYQTRFPVSRIDISFGRKQLKLNTFCFKAFAAERFPDPFKAKGFNQRVLEIQCYYGNPQEDISEVSNPAGDERLQKLLDELEETHNLLLSYRLLHFNEKIPDIKLNIKGREKQLFKPIVRVFQNTETLKKLLPVISNYVIQKREANDASFNSFLYKTIITMIAEGQRTTLASSEIWHKIVTDLEGTEIIGRSQSCETTEYGIISQKDIVQTLIHIFGAKSGSTGKIRTLTFNLPKLTQLGKIYDASIEVQILDEDNNNNNDNNNNKEAEEVTDLTHMTHIDKQEKEDKHEGSLTHLTHFTHIGEEEGQNSTQTEPINQGIERENTPNEDINN
jgi:hypothetical protein